MKLILKLLCCVGITSFNVGCRGDHAGVIREQGEARKEIDAAERDVAATEQKADQRVDRAKLRGDQEKIEDAKIRATRDIAEAKAKVEDEKIEGAREVLNAKKSAGEVSGAYQKGSN